MIDGSYGLVVPEIGRVAISVLGIESFRFDKVAQHAKNDGVQFREKEEIRLP